MRRVWLVILTCILALSASRLDYSEDIYDFLPLDADSRTAMQAYTDLSGAGRLYAIVSLTDTAGPADRDLLYDAVDTLAESLARTDTAGHLSNVVSRIDPAMMRQVVDDVYARIPYYLTAGDYARIDSLLGAPGYVRGRLEADRRALLLPSASTMIADNLAHDPLGLFTPALADLAPADVPANCDTGADGYIVTPDGRRAILMLESAHGAHESGDNGALIDLADKAVAHTTAAVDGVSVSLIGAPAIAVSNARRIKTDSILAGAIALLLIGAVLYGVLRSVRRILLIVLSVGWGMLFALGVIALFTESISVIVLGMSAVIAGLAVNYPLHYIDQLRHTPDPRAALRQIAAPLVTGNITTVAAFLCLIPLESRALHDLGLFSALILAGTILFTLAFLPALVGRGKSGTERADEQPAAGSANRWRYRHPRLAACVVIVVTAVMGWLSLDTHFDSDLRNINYLTPGQQRDLAYLQSLVTPTPGTETLYIVSTADDRDKALAALEGLAPVIDTLVSTGRAIPADHADRFDPSSAARAERLRRWHDLLGRHRALLTDTLESQASATGFSPRAFAPFAALIDRSYTADAVESATLLPDAARMTSNTAARRLHVAADSIPAVTARLREASERLDAPAVHVFDIGTLNRGIARSLTDNFNYLGIACSTIVFLFLWISFRSLRLAVVAFLPMAVSWVWILGVMSLLHIPFNIVNIILATFIFGQGDDYTIFITEGLEQERLTGRPVLRGYRQAITLSALIMFIGIGTLVISAHPALRSLGLVTIPGMAITLLLSLTLPPLIFQVLSGCNSYLKVRRGE